MKGEAPKLQLFLVCVTDWLESLRSQRLEGVVGDDGSSPGGG